MPTFPRAIYHAAAPNPALRAFRDERDGAFTIGLGDMAEQDTTSATSGETDPSQCPFEPVTVFTGHTVWYAFTSEAGGWVEVNTIGSDYDTSLFVLDGDAIVKEYPDGTREILGTVTTNTAGDGDDTGVQL